MKKLQNDTKDAVKIGLFSFVLCLLVTGLMGVIFSMDANLSTLSALRWTGQQWVAWALICTAISAIVGMIVFAWALLDA